MASFSLFLFLSIVSVLICMMEAETFESDIGNLFKEKERVDSDKEWNDDHTVLIIVIILVLMSICFVTLCCAQLRRSKLLSQYEEAELGGTIQSFAYSDDGDQILNLNDNNIEIMPSRHHRMKTEMIDASDNNMKKLKDAVLDKQDSDETDDETETESYCSDHEKQHILDNMRSGDFCVHSNSLIADN